MSSRVLLTAVVALALTGGGRAAHAQTPVANGNDGSAASSRSLPTSTGATPLLSVRIPDPAVPTGPWQRPRLTAATLGPEEPGPQIDGSIDEACWQRATRAAGFYRFNAGAPVTEQTEAWVMCDRRYLYVAFHCLDSRPDRIQANETQRGGDIFRDDHVGIDVDSQYTHRRTSTFMVTARGTQAEYLEGGTADNITWSGDWKAAARRTPDGWTCEMAVPYRLLRYNKGAKTFGLMLWRRLSRETTLTAWPYLPPGGDQNSAQFMAELNGIAPPTLAPRPVFLSYALASAGADGGENPAILREGLDIKYPLTTTLTGVASLYPDFRTVEQAVANINFSYTERLVADRRPFFAEGQGFLPYRDLFYSRRIEQVDGGFKVVGKEGNTSIGLLGTVSRGTPARPQAQQQAYVASVQRDLGLFSHVAVNMVHNQQGGGKRPNDAAKVEARWGGPWGRYRPSFLAVYAPTWVGGSPEGAMRYLNFSTRAPRGRPNVGFDYHIIPKDFVTDLGFVPDRDLRGGGGHIEQWNEFDRGPVEDYFVGTFANRYNRDSTGQFFKSYLGQEAFVAFRAGWGVGLGWSRSRRNEFRDRAIDLDLSWGRRTRFQRGGGHLTVGRQANQPYRFINVTQNFLITKPLSLALDQNFVNLGASRQRQTIVTGTYRLTQLKSIGTRLVMQSGNPDPSGTNNEVPNGTNIYFSYGQKSRKGQDVFFLIGDPNSLRTRGVATLKVIQPF